MSLPAEPQTLLRPGTYALVQSAGQDVLNITGLRDVVVVTGRATINGGTQGENDYIIQGEGVVRPGDFDTVDVSGGSATVTAAYTSFYATETDGTLRLAQTGTAPASTPSQNGGAAVRSIATPGKCSQQPRPEGELRVGRRSFRQLPSVAAGRRSGQEAPALPLQPRSRAAYPSALGSGPRW